MTVYIDSHAHLEDKKFSRDLERALERAGITAIFPKIHDAATLRELLLDRTRAIPGD